MKVSPPITSQVSFRRVQSPETCSLVTGSIIGGGGCTLGRERNTKLGPLLSQVFQVYVEDTLGKVIFTEIFKIGICIADEFIDPILLNNTVLNAYFGRHYTQ